MLYICTAIHRQISLKDIKIGMDAKIQNIL
jgi:hypothetical protein